MFINRFCFVVWMIALGIECTAHTFGVGIVDGEGKVLVNCKDSVSTVSGGLIPNDVAKHHFDVKEKVLSDALVKVNFSFKDVGLIVYSQGPGFSPCLKVGANFAKQLAKEHSLPVIGVNHCVAHLTIGQLLCKIKNCVFLYVSGVNTQVIALAGERFRIFGETLDTGLGNALDKFGRDAGLGFPAGPKIEQIAKAGKFLELPYSVKGMDVAFSGIVSRALKQLKQGEKIEDVCFSLQETCFAMMAEICERALAHTEENELLLVGGVAANKRLSEMLSVMCFERGAKFAVVPLEFAGDQAVMIAWQGLLEYCAGRRVDLDSVDFNPYWRVDEVDVIW